MSCEHMTLFESFVKNNRNPTLTTLIRLVNAPTRAEVCGG
jgi:hypothetical protein